MKNAYCSAAACLPQKITKCRCGFTLLELLAVLVILAALAMIAIPIFANKSDTAKQVGHEQNLEILQKQGNAYLLSLSTMPADGYDIIDNMVTAGYIKEKPTNPITGVKDYKVIYHTATRSVTCQTFVDIPVGKYVKFGKYRAYDLTISSYTTTDIVWRVIHKVTQVDVDAGSLGTGLQAGDLMLLSDKIITMKPYDANDLGEVDPNRHDYGNNNWNKSNLREWLNSTASTVTYNTQKPDSSHVWVDGSAVNAYDTEKGFLAAENFTVKDINKIVPVTHRAILQGADDALATGNSGVNHSYTDTDASAAVTNYDSARYKDSTDSVFLLNIKELASYVYSNAILGNGVAYTIGYTTLQARNQSNFASDPANDTTACNYWTRDTYYADSYHVRAVFWDGLVGCHYAYWGAYGVRPALFLRPSGITLDESSGDAYDSAIQITAN